MTSVSQRLFAAPALAAAACTLALSSAYAQAPATVSPALAPGVQAAADRTAPKGAYVVMNGTPLYRTPYYDPAQQTGQSLNRGERPQVVAEANQGLWLLIGRNGRGIGYAPRSLLCPATVCTQK